MFLPYKVDADLSRLPFVTIAIMIICVAVFIQQQKSTDQFRKAVTDFCQDPRNVDRSAMTVLRTLQNAETAHPCAVFFDIRKAENPDVAIHKLAEESKPMRLFQDRSDEVRYVYAVLSDAYHHFERSLPRNLTEDLRYSPQQLKFKRMITSSLSHASWTHLIGNLFGFYAFAAAVEIIIGSLFFIPIMAFMAVISSVAYSISVAGDAAALPSVGLSGVVMGVMTMLATMAPGIRIRCVLWLIIFVKTFRVPALLLAAWYVSWNIYDLNTIGEKSHINYAAHIGGAISGVILGLVYRWRNPEALKAAIPRGT